ncbi:hypothetical protein J3998_02435 [Thiomicrorhabdus sp. 6S2-11]|uniref:Porin n=1 Tax=Thiomicrorhabdus marina TaxID=2818442 RepID=A0ABS3Q272_9GAMM|nr:hypothetical protein [Thiomicrorhabdus marina]MBO1926419.1 hypothetical protein [Thiomicrorhabdus marina]
MKPSTLVKQFILMSFFGSSISAHADSNDFSFDLSAYQKKPYEISGHFDLQASVSRIDQNSAASVLTYGSNPPKSLSQYYSELEFSGLYRAGDSTLNWQTLAQLENSNLPNLETKSKITFQQLYAHFSVSQKWQIDLGKKTVKWGKSYAWNPVGFIEYTKNPEDPELSREGFVMTALNYQQGSIGAWKNLSHSLYLLPRNRDINSELNADSGMTIAFKSSLLIEQTDLDFYLRYDSASNASSQQAFGFSFASNLSSNLEIHGDFAYLKNADSWQWNSNQLSPQTQNLWQQVIGLRYLDQHDITWILEWLHQPQALASSDLHEFNQQILESTIPQTQFAKTIFNQPTALQNQFYLKASQKDWLGIVYLNASLSLLFNPSDKSFALTPEWIYQPAKNHELRLRTSWLQGQQFTQYGEKLADYKLDIRWRYYY